MQAKLAVKDEYTLAEENDKKTNGLRHIEFQLREENCHPRSLFEILGVQRMPVTQKKQKKMWMVFREDLENVRKSTLRDVMDCVVDCKLIPIPPKLEKLHSAYYNIDDVKYAKEDLKSLYSVSNLGVLSAIEFLGSNGEFSTFENNRR